MASIARSLRRAVPPAVVRLAAGPPRSAGRSPLRAFSTTRMSALPPNFPPDRGLVRRYTKEHEWVDLSADRKTGVVGISSYAAKELGDVVYVEVPPTTGDWVEQGDMLGSVESVKSASDVNAPVRCRVVEANTLLEEKPATINRVPEDDSQGGGWMARVEVDEEGAKQFDALMDAADYKSFVDE